MKKERDELWALINSDKYKNFKSAESEKSKYDEQVDKVKKELSEIQNQYQMELNEKNQLQQEVE